MIRATQVFAGQHRWIEPPADTVVLDFDDRHRRRMAMTGTRGLEFLLDLENAIALRGGDALVLEDEQADRGRGGAGAAGLRFAATIRSIWFGSPGISVTAICRRRSRAGLAYPARSRHRGDGEGAGRARDRDRGAVRSRRWRLCRGGHAQRRANRTAMRLMIIRMISTVISIITMHDHGDHHHHDEHCDHDHHHGHSHAHDHK